MSIASMTKLTSPKKAEDKHHIFKLIITIGSNEDIRNTVKANAVDMAQDGIIIKVKRIQVIHSRKGILLTMMPCSIDGKYT